MLNVNTIISELNKSDTTYEFEKVYTFLKQLIDAGVPIRYIDNNCPKLAIYSIIDYLVRYGENDSNNIDAITNYYDSLQINQDRCLVIADNHMGRLLTTEKYNKSQIFKNERGLWSAYNYALERGINYVIHLGDLLEGDSDKSQNRQKISDQFEYLENKYPNIESIKTYLLYGNHDYNITYFNDKDYSFYKSCNNMELIGVNYSYINFCNQRIKLSHYSKQSSYLRNIELSYDFELSGHSHIYNVSEEERIAHMPSLSSLHIDQSDIGFIEMINEEDEYVFKYFDDEKNEIGEKERVLSKKEKH